MSSRAFADVVEPVAQPRTGAESGRFHGVDACRIVAIVGVVWLHASGTWTGSRLSSPAVFGSFGVPFFIAATVLFAFLHIKRHRECDVFPYMVVRAGQLLLPCYGWSAVCLAIAATKSLAFGKPMIALGWWFPLTGASAEYWFLPFAFMVTSAATALAMVLVDRPRWSMLVALVCGLLSVVPCLVSSPLRWLFGDTVPFVAVAYWGHMPSLLIGTGFACWYISAPSSAPGIHRPSGMAAFIAFIVFIGALMAQSLLAWAGYVGGFALLVVGLYLPSHPYVTRIASLGRYTYGIYLIHVIALWPMFSLARRLSNVSLPMVVLFTMAAFGISLTLTMLLRRGKQTRWLVP